VENLSEHPLAHAVVTAARARGLELLPAANLQAVVGKGVRAEVDERTVWIGRPVGFTGSNMMPIDDLAAAGKTPLIVADLGSTPQSDRRTPCVEADAPALTEVAAKPPEVLGVLAIADTLRPTTAEALGQLRALGITHLTMLTGDNRRVAEAIAGRLGIDFEAELLPDDKLQAIRRLREKYGPVAMVGDGINDAPSLAAADLGVSLGGAGTDVALETADVVLMADDLIHLPYAIALARQAQRIIRQNLVFALGVIAILLTLTLAGSLSLPFAVIGHEGSTVLVILNGLRMLAFPKPRS
jgi:Cd2+/Zn2+-exporting ATPase